MKKFKIRCVHCVDLTIVLLFYSLFFLVNVGAGLKSSSFMGIDEASIIESIRVLIDVNDYNMNNAYHSRYYGWTYVALSSLILKLISLVSQPPEYFVNGIIRALHFSYGAVFASFAYLVLKYYVSRPIAVILTVLFLTFNDAARYLNEIHPESLGAALQVISIYIFHRVFFSRSFDSRLAYIGIIAFVLSSMCKQSFAIANILYFSAFVGFCYYEGVISYPGLSKIGEFSRLIGRWLFLSVIVAFLVHPYAFLQPSRFLGHQIDLKSGAVSTPFSDVAKQWSDAVTSDLLYSSIIILLLTAPFFWRRRRLFSISLIITALCMLLFVFNQRMFVSTRYIFPVAFVGFLNAVYFIKLLVSSPHLLNRILGGVIGIYSSVTLILSSPQVIIREQNRFFSDGTRTADLAWDYLQSLDGRGRLVYTPTVPVPNNFRGLSCSVWHGCGTLEGLRAYNPKYLAIVPNYRYYDATAVSSFLSSGYELVKSFEPISYQRSVCYAQSLPYFPPRDVFSYLFGCYSSYRDMVENHRIGRVVNGDRIEIYRRVRD